MPNCNSIDLKILQKRKREWQRRANYQSSEEKDGKNTKHIFIITNIGFFIFLHATKIVSNGLKLLNRQAM